MILLFVEIVNPAALETLLMGIPESVGTLAFGVGLVVTAVLIRRLLSYGDGQKYEEKAGSKV